jgi:hypothetical protein
VTITLSNVATNVVRTVQTNESGLYVITAIPPGTYDMKAELSGFGTVERKAILVQVGNAHRIPFTLQVGDLSESIVVQAHSPLIQTENAAISTVIENRAIVELPLNGRNYLQLASLIPGATTNGPSSSQGKQRMGGQRNSFALNVAGQRIHFNHYSLDGVENTDLNFNSYMLLPSWTRSRSSTSSPACSTPSTAARSRKSTSRPSPDRTSFAARSSSSRAIPRSTPRTSSIARTCRSRRSSATSTGSRSAVPVVLPKIVDGRNKLFFMFNWEGLRENKSLTQTPSLPLDRVADGRFLGSARRQRQPDSDLRSGDTRVRRAGNVLQAPTQFPAIASRRIAFIRFPEGCWPTTRCRSRR